MDLKEDAGCEDMVWLNWLRAGPTGGGLLEKDNECLGSVKDEEYRG
jgi:hypothetical protein